MRFPKPAMGIVGLIALLLLSLIVTPTPAKASSTACYAAGCNGLDPKGRCDSDAITVASKAVTEGQLDLRYSKTCAANWGRYTPNTFHAQYLFFVVQKGIDARVTAWNPDESSYGRAHQSFAIAGSSWSQMVDGTKKACVGVGITYFSR